MGGGRWSGAGWGASCALVLTVGGVSGAAPLGAQTTVAGLSPMFRGEPTHSGVVEATGVETLGGVAWRFDAGGAVRSSPALMEGVLYVGGTSGRLFALDVQTGSAEWAIDVGASVVSSPAVTADLVIVGDRHNTFHAVSRATGSAVWRKATGEDLALPWGLEGWDYLMASPVPLGSVTLLPSGDGTLYAVETSSGEERWRFETGARIRSTPAVEDGVVFFGSGDGVVHALQLETGEVLWQYETDGTGYDAAEFGFDRRQIQASPTVVGDQVIIGSRDASLYGLDRSSGRKIWSFEDGSSWVVSTPAVRGDTVWSARSSSTRVRAIDRTSGEEIWVIETGGPVFSSPVLAGGTLYVGSGGGSMYALDASNGQVRWQFGAGAGVYGTPVVANGRVYFGSDDGFVYALEAAQGRASPRLAVFWDDDAMALSNLGGREPHRQIADYFAGQGYERLDTMALAGFLESSLENDVPSVIVFAMDYLPATVSGDSDRPEDSLFRRYLDRGGKVVWLSSPPLAFVRDPETGGITGLDREGPSRLLDVDHSGWNTDVYPLRITSAGERWGLTSTWMSGPVASAADVTEVLVEDEKGRPVAWVRNYGGAPGTGFVHLRPTWDRTILEEVRRVAEYGIYYGAGG